MNTSDAAYHVVHDYPGSSPSLAPRVGMSAAMLRNKVNPDNFTHKLTLAEAEKLTAVTGDVRILKAWAHAEGYLLVKAPDGAEECDMSILEGVTGSVFSHGGFVGSINESLADGGVSPQEMKQIERAAKKAMTAIANLVSRLRGMVG